MDDDLPIVEHAGLARPASARAVGRPRSRPPDRPSNFSYPQARDRATLRSVRGDSRRDLYSKTLALCGLGVLAGAGALVDYWPVGVRFYIPASPELSTPSIASASTAPSDPLLMLAGLLDTAREVPSDRTHVAAAPLFASADYASLPVVAVGYDVGTSVDVQPLPEPAFVHVRNDLPVWSGAAVHLRAPRSVEFDETFPQAAADSSGGFITGAFRKTGTSIVRTGVWTGSSLVGAVRVVGGMVRRALPD
jgi:hypothetical protein